MQLRWREAMAATAGFVLAVSAAVAQERPAAAPAAAAEQQKVATAQLLLHVLGLYDGTTHGTLGPRTVKALSDYQQKLKLPVTGKPDARTLYALGHPSAVSACADAGMAVADCLDNVSAMGRFLALKAPASNAAGTRR